MELGLSHEGKNVRERRCLARGCCRMFADVADDFAAILARVPEVPDSTDNS
jgi:hypothetical protein